MNIPEFVMPATLDDSLQIKRQYGTEARVIAGATDLILRMRDKVLAPSLLIDLQRTSLNHINLSSEYLSLGALVTVSQILENRDIAGMFPAIPAACRMFAGPPIRNRATLGGNIVNASPAADLVSPMIAYDAEIVLKSVGKERVLPLLEFFLGPGQSVIKADEILIEIRLPLPPASTVASFSKLGQRRSMAISQVNLSTRLSVDERGLINAARIVLGAVAPVPMRAVAAEAMLSGKELSEELLCAAARKAPQEIVPISDIRASRAYRLEMTEVFVRRSLLAAGRDLTGGTTDA
ncbi:MAG: xanthine dehydrogenase family protein subunit M [Gammaproteobacteria bacterium]|nr:xanthine dehydrogenase family protein subunit M [Gammaproteobacteria bacterium]